MSEIKCNHCGAMVDSQPLRRRVAVARVLTAISAAVAVATVAFMLHVKREMRDLTAKVEFTKEECAFGRERSAAPEGSRSR